MLENLATKINLDTGIINSLDVNNFRNVLVLTGTYYSLKVFREKVEPLIKTNFHLFSQITPNPTENTIYSIVAFAKAKKIDCIISIGGGSVMDCGRLASLLLSHGGFLNDYLLGGRIGPMGITSNVIHHITVPTISGTGAEISGTASIIFNKGKVTIASPYLMPKVTFIDPVIMQGINDKRWAAISFDCFATALAAYVSIYANPTSDAFAEQALKGYIGYSLKLLKDTDNVDYIKQMAVASINAFIAASFSSTGAAHAIADVLSARFDIQNGVALAIVCGEIAQINYDYNKEKFDKVLAMLKGTKDIKTVINSWVNKLGITLPSLKGKLDKTELEPFARECINFSMRGNPKTITPLEIVEILKKLF